MVGRRRNRIGLPALAGLSPMLCQWRLVPLSWSRIPPEHNPDDILESQKPSEYVMPCLDVTCSPVEIQMEIFYLSELCKLVGHVFFCSFFVDISYQDNPSLDG